MTNRPWSAAEEYRLQALVEEHHGYRTIARRLGRTVAAVQSRAKALGCTITTANGRTVGATARLLGVDAHAVLWWIRAGWLAAHDTGGRMGRGTLTIVEHDDLLAFLEEERYWPAWSPDRIRDRGLRAWAEELRAGVRLLTTGEVGARIGLTHYAVNQAIHRGCIPAVKVGPHWYVRAADAVYPTPRRAVPGRPTTPEQWHSVFAWWGTVDAEEIGRRIGCSGSAVHTIARRLGLPRLGRGCWKRQAERAERAA